MVNQTAKMAMQRTGSYYHMLPEFSQARKVMWDALDGQGNRIIDQAFPLGLRTNTNDSEMKIKLKGGSIWQLVGSDRYDAIMGTNPVGLVFSEYSISNPAAWDYVRPILAENGGWASFVYTPRGRNHGYSLFNMASGDPSWFASIQTVDDTKGVSLEAIDSERRAGMPEDMIQQEFFCSFTSGALGSYYGKIMEDLRKGGRITIVPYNPALSTELWFDLGWNDYTSIWVVQRAGLQLNCIRYAEWTTTSLPRICEAVREWGYRIDSMKLPHDADHHELISGRTRQDVIEDELRCKADVVARPKNMAQKLEQIHAVRATLPLCVFDSKLCEVGIYALESYSRKWDEKHHVFAQEPQHDWSSHCADAFRTGCSEERESTLMDTPAGRRAYVNQHRVITAAHGQKGRSPDDDWMVAARSLD
jgi:hypothetical protein